MSCETAVSVLAQWLRDEAGAMETSGIAANAYDLARNLRECADALAAAEARIVHLLQRDEWATSERDALRAQVATLREALEQVAGPGCEGYDFEIGKPLGPCKCMPCVAVQALRDTAPEQGQQEEM